MTVEIKLPSGEVALIDDEDADLLKYEWKAHRAKAKGKPAAFTSYAYRNLRKDERHLYEGLYAVLLHREIAKRMGILQGSEQIDHADKNRLNNRRSNLRGASVNQNMWNQSLSSLNTSGVKGVRFSDHMGFWVARIVVYKKEIFLGHFNNIEDATTAYDLGALYYYGEFASLNRPRGFYSGYVIKRPRSRPVKPPAETVGTGRKGKMWYAVVTSQELGRLWVGVYPTQEEAIKARQASSFAVALAGI